MKTIDKYLGYIEAYISLITNNLFNIWRTDDNGQLSRDETNSKYNAGWNLRNKLGNIKGKNLCKSCESNEWVARNNFSPTGNSKANLATRQSNGGAILKQLDYILIEHRYRNWAKKITNNTLGNMSPPTPQHRAIMHEFEIALKMIILPTPIIHMAHMDGIKQAPTQNSTIGN